MRRIPKNLRHRKRSVDAEVAMNSSGGDIVTNDPSLTMSGLKETGHPTKAAPIGKRARSQRTMNRKIVATCGIELTQILKQLSSGDSRVPQTKNICRSIGRHSPDTMSPKNSQCVSLGSSPSAGAPLDNWHIGDIIPHLHAIAVEGKRVVAILVRPAFFNLIHHHLHGFSMSVYGGVLERKAVIIAGYRLEPTCTIK